MYVKIYMRNNLVIVNFFGTLEKYATLQADSAQQSMKKESNVY